MHINWQVLHDALAAGASIWKCVTADGIDVWQGPDYRPSNVVANCLPFSMILFFCFSDNPIWPILCGDQGARAAGKHVSIAACHQQNTIWGRFASVALELLKVRAVGRLYTRNPVDMSVVMVEVTEEYRGKVRNIREAKFISGSLFSFCHCNQLF